MIGVDSICTCDDDRSFIPSIATIKKHYYSKHAYIHTHTSSVITNASWPRHKNARIVVVVVAAVVVVSVEIE